MRLIGLLLFSLCLTALPASAKPTPTEAHEPNALYAAQCSRLIWDVGTQALSRGATMLGREGDTVFVEGVSFSGRFWCEGVRLRYSARDGAGNKMALPGFSR